MMWAMSSGAGVGKRGAGLGVNTGVVDIGDRQVAPGESVGKPWVVIAATGVASAIMNSMRAGGCTGSIGRYAAPVFSTARIATIASAERASSSATHSPWAGPTLR